MEIKVRNEAFETNSSSTHSLVMMMKNVYINWQNNGLYFYNGEYDYYWENQDIKPIKGCLYPPNEVIEFIKKGKYYSEKEYSEYDEDDIDYYYAENGFISSEYYDGIDMGDSFCEEFSTPNGETIVAFGGIVYD